MGIGILLVGVLLELIALPKEASPGTIDPDIAFRLGKAFVPTVVVMLGVGMLSLRGYTVTHEKHSDRAATLSDRV